MTEAGDANAREFFLKEYDALQARLAFARTDLVRMETIAPFAAGAIIAWGIAHPEIESGYRVAIFAVPFVITMVVGLRYLSRYRMVVRIEAYLQKLEAVLCGEEEPRGYERFIWKSGKGSFGLLRASRYLMWATMVLISGAMLGDAIVQL